MNSKQLKSLRLDYGLTQGQMADLLSIDRVTLWRWETGKYPIGIGAPEEKLLSNHMSKIIDNMISGLTGKGQRSMRRRVEKRLAGGGD